MANPNKENIPIIREVIATKSQIAATSNATTMTSPIAAKKTGNNKIQT